jgi:hypothetical protein
MIRCKDRGRQVFEALARRIDSEMLAHQSYKTHRNELLNLPLKIRKENIARTTAPCMVDLYDEQSPSKIVFHFGHLHLAHDHQVVGLDIACD